MGGDKLESPRNFIFILSIFYVVWYVVAWHNLLNIVVVGSDQELIASGIVVKVHLVIIQGFEDFCPRVLLPIFWSSHKKDLPTRYKGSMRDIAPWYDSSTSCVDEAVVDTVSESDVSVLYFTTVSADKGSTHKFGVRGSSIGRALEQWIILLSLGSSFQIYSCEGEISCIRQKA